MRPRRESKARRERELDRLEASLGSQGSFLAASAYWEDGPNPERVEERRRDLAATCREYVEAFDRLRLP